MDRLSTSDLNRRAFLLRAGGAAAALSGSSLILAACGGSSGGAGSTAATAAAGGTGRVGVGGIPIATKSNPVKLPLYSDNTAIASGLAPEKGPLEVFDWASYLSPEVVKSFEQEHGVKVNVTNFASYDEAVKKIRSGAVKPDAWVPVVDRLPQLVAAKIVQPINHSYIPNLKNVLPVFADPYYDQGSQYSVPNFVWTTGIAWRADKLPDFDPSTMSNPWDAFWTEDRAIGKMGVQNAASFDPLSLALLRMGIRDFSNLTDQQINDAGDQLLELNKRGVKLHYTAFQALADGTEILSQAWMGDAFVAPSLLPKGTPADVVQYWFPEDGSGSANSDEWVIPKTAENPVLGHLWLNHLLTYEQAVSNYTYVGYQQPLSTMTLAALKKDKVGAPELLDEVYVTDTQAANGLPNPTPTVAQVGLIDKTFATFSSGAK